MKKWVISFAIIGFLGAAAFYCPWINAQSYIACPVCVHVTMGGLTQTQRFLRLTLVFGIFNAALFAAVAFVGVACLRLLKWLMKT